MRRRFEIVELDMRMTVVMGMKMIVVMDMMMTVEKDKRMVEYVRMMILYVIRKEVKEEQKK